MPPADVDDEAIRRAQMDQAWKMVLDTLDQDDSPVSKGTLQNVRNRLIATGMDRALLARTVELARERVHFQGLPARICWLGYG